MDERFQGNPMPGSRLSGGTPDIRMSSKHHAESWWPFWRSRKPFCPGQQGHQGRHQHHHPRQRAGDMSRFTVLGVCFDKLLAFEICPTCGRLQAHQ